MSRRLVAPCTPPSCWQSRRSQPSVSWPSYTKPHATGSLRRHVRAHWPASTRCCADCLYDNDLLADTLTLRDPELLGTTEAVTAYRARFQGQPVAFVLEPVAPDGYSGTIRLLIAVTPDGTVLGTRTVSHHETPGLGDFIDAGKSDWMQRFTGKSLGNPAAARWRVRKDGGDFDQYTGATITSRAVVGTVGRTLEFFARHRDELLGDELPAAPATIQP
ncbi:MAG: electron transport complex subunit RsxG [Proteobacteria bacterium]|nr:electron transport complex subunit RsxG [Pseudomonadota bacterium]